MELPVSLLPMAICAAGGETPNAWELVKAQGTQAIQQILERLQGNSE